MVYVQYSTSSHNLQIYHIWYNSIFIMSELTMVDLSVYTNHRLGICIITHPFLTMFYPLLQFWFSFEAVYFPRSRCSRLGIGEIDRFLISEVVVHYYVGSKRRCEEKGFVLDPVYVWQRCLLDPGTRPKETGILFRTFWFCGNRCSHIEGARRIAIPEVS